MKAGEGRQEQKTSKPRILGEIRWRSRAGQESWVWERSQPTDRHPRLSPGALGALPGLGWLLKAGQPH